jgi:hypothetical protein
MPRGVVSMARAKRTGEGRKSSKHQKGDIDEFEPVHEGEGDEFEPVEGEDKKEGKGEDEDEEEFEPVEGGDTAAGEEEEEFEPVEGEGKDEGEEEFEPVPEEPPVEIKLSRMKVKGGEEAGVEPTIEEILAYATGKTKKPTEAPPPKRDRSGDLAKTVTKARARRREEEAKGKRGKGGKAKKGEADKAKAAEEDEDPLAELFEGSDKERR